MPCARVRHQRRNPERQYAMDAALGGQSVDPRVYQPRARFGACNEARDVKADIDEDAIMKHLQREARLRGRHGAIRLHD